MGQSAQTFEYDLDQKDPNKGMWVITGIIILIIAAFFFLRSEPTDFADTAELSAVLTDGQPKVLEFYSNF